ncbi:MAG: hypothetical protein ABJ056_01070 [Halioglobus sp.]
MNWMQFEISLSRWSRVTLSLFAACIMSGCSSISYPVWLGDDGVAEMCESDGLYSYTHVGETKEFEVHLVDSQGISENCGKFLDGGRDIRACILFDRNIFVTPGPTCQKDMAHELSHGFGMHFVDRPLVNRS